MKDRKEETMANRSQRPTYAYHVAEGLSGTSFAERVRWFQSLSFTQQLEWLAASQQFVWDMNGGCFPRKSDVSAVPGTREVIELPESAVRSDRRKRRRPARGASKHV